MAKTGVNIRSKSIRVTFTFDRKQHHHTLTLNGRSMPPTPPNIRHAERLAAEIQEKIRLGTFSMAEYFPVNGDAGQLLTVGVQMDTWLKAQRLEASTRAGYASAVRFWKLQGLGDIALRQLKHSDILLALAKRFDLNGKTVNNYVQVLREALELAVTDGTLKENPVAKIPRAKRQKPAPDPFTSEEAELILGHMAKHYPEAVWNVTEFRFFTGLRTAELSGLRWGSVDLQSKYCTVRESLVRGVEKNTTKTHFERKVKLNSRALTAILRQAKHTRMRGDHVFLDPRYDLPWTEERAYRRSYWTPTLKALGIRYRRPYATRHTYATYMLMATMNHSFCATQLGHSVEIFQTTYSKWMGGDRDDLEMDKLEPLYAQTMPRSKRKSNFSSENVGVADGARTHDNRNHNPGLYQLSYSHR